MHQLRKMMTDQKSQVNELLIDLQRGRHGQKHEAALRLSRLVKQNADILERLVDLVVAPPGVERTG